MENLALPSTIIVAGVTVFSALAGAWLGARLASDTARKLAIQQGYLNLTTAFLDELVVLKLGPVKDDDGVYDLLIRQYPKHLAAYIKLRALLSGEELATLDCKWKKYVHEKDVFEDQTEIWRFSRFQYDPNEPKSKDSKRLAAISAIESLIDP
jgi:hypothetical protein